MGRIFFIFKVNTVEKVLRDLFQSRHAALSANTHDKLCARNLTLSLRSSVSSCPVMGERGREGAMEVV